MAVPAGVKLDDGTGGYAANCFPVRSVIRPSDEFGGAWLVSHRAEQRRRFKAILCTKPKTYDDLKQERKQQEKEARARARASASSTVAGEDDETPGLLDGFFLLRHCCVEDPSDLCSVNIIGQDLSEVREEDFQLFDNVAYVNASENLLPFEAFNNFPIIRELEMPINGLRNLKIDLDDFPCLEVLDLSYNNLSQEDILTLGLLAKLKVLHLSGNNLRCLPSEMAQPVKFNVDDSSMKVTRFANLEILFLDDNKLTDLTTFANLAGLRKLKRLNLDKNSIYSVPHLKAMGGKMVESEPPSLATTPRHATPHTAGDSASLPSSRRSSRGATSRKSSRNELEEEVINNPSASLIESTLKEIKEEEEVDDNYSNHSTNQTTQSSELFTRESPPPFPELEFLSLAYNQIAEEEGLLAVAAWPMLTELVIHNNPLTTLNSGDPPLLKRYLVDRLGIHITRLSPQKPQKPGPRVPIKKDRKVSSHVPKVPKVPVEQLMLEGPSIFALPSSEPPTPQPHPPLRARSAPNPTMEHSKPLPPITPTLPPSKPEVDEDDDEDKMSRTQTWMEENFQKEDSNADDPVFLTQVDDQVEEDMNSVQDKVQTQKTSKMRPDSAAVSMNMPDKYKGYELLLDAEDDPDLMLPKDIHGNVKALEFALKHPTVYRDNTVALDRIQKPFEPYQKSKVDYGKKHKDKAEKLEEILEDMKNRIITQEASLAAILADKKKYAKELPEATKLLAEIQGKYKTVHAASMKEDNETAVAIADTLKTISESKKKLKSGHKKHSAKQSKEV
ncbi:X-ray radiation resistance-associated protein 1-like [Saccoglossus kowalevskii]|uniref:X-ray radiation resistance-associated protein 1-like n=1 Tax=Saccoglossus kowalevskii TaxID=10224 RepID=A0ABM0GW41_SACKO|nr:PREDICTED: X-ray radiation resistance-associated protein 1-like [Saccoglossus kowalevskii]